MLDQFNIVVEIFTVILDEKNQMVAKRVR